MDKEAEAWTRSELNDIEAFNRSIRELYSMAIDDLDEAFGIFEDELVIEDNPKSYAPRHLFNPDSSIEIVAKGLSCCASGAPAEFWLGSNVVY